MQQRIANHNRVPEPESRWWLDKTEHIVGPPRDSTSSRLVAKLLRAEGDPFLYIQLSDFSEDLSETSDYDNLGTHIPSYLTAHSFGLFNNSTQRSTTARLSDNRWQAAIKAEPTKWKKCEVSTSLPSRSVSKNEMIADSDFDSSRKLELTPLALFAHRVIEIVEKITFVAMFLHIVWTYFSWVILQLKLEI